MEDNILEFISRRFTEDCHWLDGNCYYFSVILKDRFPVGRIVYDVIAGHFYFEWNDRLYDFAGVHNITEDMKIIPFDMLSTYDRKRFDRILRDCVD